MKKDERVELLFDLTNRCVQDLDVMCKGCQNGLVIGNEMTTETIKNFLENSIKDVGINTVHIGGGEPLQHPDILQILDFLWQRGINIYLYTRGVIFDPNEGDYYQILSTLAVVFQKYGDVDAKRGRWGDATGHKFGVVFNPCGMVDIVEKSIRNCVESGIAVCLVHTNQNDDMVKELDDRFERTIDPFMVLKLNPDKEVTGYISNWRYVVQSNGIVLEWINKTEKVPRGNVKIKSYYDILMESLE